jgi:hypothetical protein
VVAGEASYKMRHPGVAFCKICITNQFFNSTAKTHADLNSVKLLGQTHLAELLKKFPVTMLDVEKLVFAKWGADFNDGTSTFAIPGTNSGSKRRRP